MRALPIALLVTVVMAAAGCRRDHSGAWPTRPVRIVVPFGAGSGVDLVARLLAPRLSARWRQPVVVDNRPGADGVVGVQTFLAARDGHTLLFTPAGQVTLTPLLHDPPPFDAPTDLLPIAATVYPSIGIAVAASVHAESLGDLAEDSRAAPAHYLWAAVPGLPDVIFRAFLAIEQAPMTYVPYREQAMAVQDLGAGRIHVLTASVATLSPLLQAGRARLVAVATPARIAAAPDVPTTTEAGYPVLATDGRWGFYGQRDLSVELRDRLADDIRFAVEDAGLIARFEAMGLTMAFAGAREFSEAVEAQRRQVLEIARLAGLAPVSDAGAR